jgi:pimeloyl-ACP methyl ester carboxylesterase
MLAGRATIIEADVAGGGADTDGEPLRLSDYAGAVAQVVGAEIDGPLVVVGHQLGGLVALRLVVDQPRLADGLLLLDPIPPTPATAVKAIALSTRLLVGLGPLGQRLWSMRARIDVRGVALDAEQERALAAYTDRRFLAAAARWAPHLVADCAALARDLADGGVSPIPAVIISAGHHRALSPIRHGHQQLAAWLPNAELAVWADAPYPLHIQQPVRVADQVLALLQRVERAGAAGV